MIRVGLVGFGLGGRVLHAPVISSVDGLELAAVVERSTDVAAGRYPSIAVYRTLEALLADASLDLIVLTTPSGTHFELARKILAAGKNLVIDKPMCITSAQVAELMKLAHEKRVLLTPYHNRRFDSDFRTVQKLVSEGVLGRLVGFDAAMDRWRPGATRARWKDDAAQGGGLLYDLGSHMAYLALILFGLPEAVSAEVGREREGDGADDAFTIRLRYSRLEVTLAANNLAAEPRPRFYLRGTRGSYSKHGVDPQEAALGQITRIGDADWGREPEDEWGTLTLDMDGKLETTRLEPLAGDYRLFYAGIRDALLGKGPAPVEALEGWRTIRLLEYAQQSARERREIPCDWTREPA
jgi:scyllo-inositol 2-dehydrogenase (NADP+)